MAMSTQANETIKNQKPNHFREGIIIDPSDLVMLNNNGSKNSNSQRLPTVLTTTSHHIRSKEVKGNRTPPSSGMIQLSLLHSSDLSTLNLGSNRPSIRAMAITSIIIVMVVHMALGGDGSFVKAQLSNQQQQQQQQKQQHQYGHTTSSAQTKQQGVYDVQSFAVPPQQQIMSPPSAEANNIRHQQQASRQSQILQSPSINAVIDNNSPFRPIIGPATQSVGASGNREQLARPSGSSRAQQTTSESGPLSSSLQEAESSQDPYMTPNDLNDIMRSHQAHYRGQSSSPSANSLPIGGQASSNHGGRLWGSQSNNQMNNKYDGPQQASPSNHAANAANANDGGYYDENDYDDDGSADRPTPVAPPPHRQHHQNQQQQHQQNHHHQGSSSNHQQRRNYQNHNHEGPSSYSAGNDDAYFNRRGTQPNVAGLRSAASYNRDHQGINYGSDGEQALNGGGGGSGEANGQQDAGFGPGPNEAYMAERNENSNGGGADGPDEDSPYDGPSGPDGAGADDDGPPPQGFGGPPPGPDQQSTNQFNYKEPIRGDNRMSAINGGSHNGQANGANSGPPPGMGGEGDESDSADEGSNRPDGDASEGNDGFPMGYDPSSGPQADMEDSPRGASPVAAASYQGPSAPSSSPPGGRSSASAPAPSSAMSPLAMRLQQQQQRQQIANSQGQGQQSSQAYNPQNNPSHVGKYFIN